MVVAPLATVADLEARKVDTSDANLINALLDAASDMVRSEVGILTRGVYTVSMVGSRSRRMMLPGRPVHSVSSVEVDGETVTDWKLVGSSLWRSTWWDGACGEPVVVTVTGDWGYEDIPSAVVDLVASMVAAGVAASGSGYDPMRRFAYERIDDYQYGLRQGDNEVLSVMELPNRTLSWLRRNYGFGSYVISEAR